MDPETTIVKKQKPVYKTETFIEKCVILLESPQFKATPDIINARSFNNETPLHFAARKNNANLIKYMIACGASIEAVTNKDLSDTPLHLAAAEGNLKVVKEMLKRIGNINVHTIFNKLIFVAIVGGLDVDEPNCFKTAKKFTNAEELKYAEIVDLLLNTGMKMNDNDGHYGPIHCAAQLDRFLILQRILKEDIRVDSVDPYGWSALHLAIQFASDRTVKILINAGADVTQKCSVNGYSPIHLLADAKNFPAFTVLIDSGADVNSKTNEGNTILDFIFGYNSEDAFFLYNLINCRFDVNAPGEWDNIGVHRLIYFYNSKYAGILFDWFLNFNVKNMENESPLEWAISMDQPIETIEFIIKIIVKMEADMKLKISDTNQTIILEHYEDLYLQCKAELKDMKKQNVWDQITFFDLINKPIEELIDYTHNSELMEKIKIDSCKLYPAYGGLMYKRMEFACFILENNSPENFQLFQ